MSRIALVVTFAFAAGLVSVAAAQDWPQWGGTSLRNNTPEGKNIPVEWNVGGFDRKTGRWKKEKAKNIKWMAELGSQTYCSPVVAGGQVYVGTNNGAGYLKRYSSRVDLGCTLCFREADGKFLWQFSAEKLPGGLVHDWPLQGILGSPLVEGDRMWLVSNRCEVVCLDTRGFHDEEDDGPVKLEWGRQFSAPSLVHHGLNDGDISQSLAALFEKAGYKIERGAEVDVKEQDKKWIIRWYDRESAEEQKLQVRIEHMSVIGSQLVTKGKMADVMDLFSADARLALGLDERKLADTLRTHFSRSGIELPASASPRAIELGKRWEVRSEVGGVDRQFRLRVDGERIIGEKLLTPDDKSEADVVWRFDMMKELNVHPHNYSPCSVTAWGDTLFVCTSNGVDESHRDIPHPEAPSFLALDKHTGQVLWSDNSPGEQIMHTQWSSPTVGVLGGVPQVIFAGGDGWLYSFRADRWKDKKPELLWKFDGNHKESVLMLGPRGGRSEIVAIPVIYDGLVYFSLGQDPEHGERPGILWCVDPTKRGDVSPTLAVRADDHSKLLPRRRVQSVDRAAGEAEIPNPNSAALWQYERFDQNGDGEFQSQEILHLSRSSVAIKNGLLVIADFSGVVHCLDAKSGDVHWTHDQLSACWSSPLIVDHKIYVGDEDGDVTIFGLSARREEAFRKPPDGKGDFTPLAEINVDSALYTTPIVANNVLFIANKTHLFAIEGPGK